MHCLFMGNQRNDFSTSWHVWSRNGLSSPSLNRTSPCFLPGNHTSTTVYIYLWLSMYLLSQNVDFLYFLFNTWAHKQISDFVLSVFITDSVCALKKDMKMSDKKYKPWRCIVLGMARGHCFASTVLFLPAVKEWAGQGNMFCFSLNSVS